MAQEITLKVPCLKGGCCVNTVTRTLESLPSVQFVEADLKSKLVRLHFEESSINPDRIREALDEIGFCPDSGK